MTPDDFRIIVREELQPIGVELLGVRADMETIRDEVKTVRDEVKTIRDEVKTIRAEAQASEARLIELVRDTETKLLKAFHRYAEVQDVRIKKVESNEGNNARALEIRLSALEEDLREVQARLQKSGI